MREDQLLQRFSAKGSQEAFAELVRRHLDFVYSVCRRKVGNADLAQDITQTVFLLLAAKASSLKPGTVLSGWLFQTAHHACQNALRSEARREYYERKAIEEMDHAAGGRTPWNAQEPWSHVEPLLDDALAQLSVADRDAVLLRYVEEMSPEEMAVALGISAAAAQKRVSRALDRLRRSLARAGTAVTVTVIGVLLAEEMVQAAPPATADGILTAISQTSLSAANGLSAAASSTVAGLGGQTNWVRLGQPASLSKTNGILVAVLLGAAAVGIGGKAYWNAVQAHTNRPLMGSAAAVPEKTITLRGSVVAPGGIPVADTAVTLLRYASPGGTLSKWAEARTDGMGRYTVSGPDSGPDADQWAVVADSGTRLGFGVPGTPCVLLPPTQIRLHVVGRNGQPLPHVRIQPLLLTGVDAAGRQETVNLALDCPKRLVVGTDPGGGAVFAGLPQGFIATFAVLDQAYQRRPPSADGLLLAAGTDSGDATVTLAPGASVAGRLLYEATEQPASGVRIGAQETSTSAWGEAQTDANGFYQIKQLPPGRYNIAVDEDSPALEAGWTAAAVPNVTLGVGQTRAGQDMRLVRGTFLTGKVTHLGSQRPFVGTEIGAYGPAHPATGAWVGGGWTQADGTYHIRVPPGPQHVYPMALSGGGGTDITVRTGQTRVIDFAIP